MVAKSAARKSPAARAKSKAGRARKSRGTSTRSSVRTAGKKKARPKKAVAKRAPRQQPKAQTATGDLLRFVENLKRQWVSTIDALVDPLMIVGSDYVIRKANIAMAKMSNQEVRGVVGKKCFQVFAKRASPCPGCQLQATAASASSRAFELERQSDRHVYEVISQPLFDEDGRLDAMVHVYRDRTEAKKMQAHMAQQDKLASIGLLAGGVAHEINNPLGGILIFSQMLLREMSKDSPHYPDVVEIESATQRCKAIVESLLDFARQNPADGSAKREEVNVIEAIRTAMRFGRVSGHQHGHVEIKEKFAAETQILLGDRTRIVQVFLNLIQNALQAMPDGGKLVIRGRSRVDGDGRLMGVYEVEDTGIGIPPENLQKIFDPFFTTKDPGEGTGLGLALCYGIVQDLSGTMTATSKVNVGSKFTVELPLTRAEPLRSAS